MQPRDAHQVRDAGAVEELPFLARNGALVADRQRGENSRGRRRAERREEPVAHRLPCLLDPVQKTISGSKSFLFTPATHISGRADAALEQPGFVIEAVRIDQPVRPTQAQREEPALAWMNAV